MSYEGPPVIQPTSKPFTPVPAETRALSGDKIDTSGDIWTLVDKKTVRDCERNGKPLPRKDKFDFQRLEGLCTPEHINGCKWLWHTRLRRMNKSNEAGKYKTLYDQYASWYVKLVTWLHGRLGGGLVDVISLADVTNFKAAHKDHVYRKIQKTLQIWVEKKFYGVHPDVEQLVFDPNKRGDKADALKHVKFLDPVKGPLLESEEKTYLRLMLKAYHADEEKDRLDLYDYCLARLTLALGQRPESTHQLRLKHLEVIPNERGDRFYFIHMPWSKQDKPEEPTRFPLATEIGRAIHSLVENVRLRFPQDTLPDGMTWYDLPLFPDPREATPIPESAYDLGRRIERVSKKIKFVSDVKGAPKGVKIVGGRMMRYTTGTRLAFKLGATEEQIARALLQKQPRQCRAYVHVAKKVLKSSGFDEKYGPVFKHYSDIALNRVVDEDDEAARKAGHLIVRYSDDGKNRPGVGRCGDRDCHYEGPIECYPCDQFRPWLRGPHEKVLGQLQAEQLEIAEIDPTRKDALDDIIIAVLAVIDACERTLADMED